LIFLKVLKSKRLEIAALHGSTQINTEEPPLSRKRKAPSGSILSRILSWVSLFFLNP
jgi:hypothetical protein